MDMQRLKIRRAILAPLAVDTIRSTWQWQAFCPLA